MAEPIRIDDPDDPRIEPFRAVRERDLVVRRGHFIAEGEVVLRAMLTASPHRPVSLLILDSRLDALADPIARLPDEVPVHVAARDVIDRIVGFPLHRGVLALGRRAEPPEPDRLLAGLPEDAVVLVLVGIANHDNMGGIFRNAAAFGADAVLIDAASCDPFYRKAIRVSVGAALIVPFARLAPGTDPVDLVGRHGFAPIALSPAAPAALSDLTRPPRAALLFGTEGPGLPADLIRRCETVGIAMAAGFDSLNVATTSGIALHHLTRVARPRRP